MVVDDRGGDETGGNDTATGDTGEDTDTSGDTDSGKDTDTDPVQETSEGDYEGSMEGAVESNWGGLDCSGDVSFSIDGKGVLEGTATCEFDDGGNGYPGLDGTLAGEERGGALLLVWTLEARGYEWDADGSGKYADGVVDANIGYESDYGDFIGTIRAERQ